jgi:D-3-phosphoglycerate dehydrogenase
MSVLILEPQGYSPRALEIFSSLGPVWTTALPQTSWCAVQWLVVRLAHRLDEQLLGRFPNLRAIVTPTTGLTHIDMTYCARRGLRVYSLADCRDAIQAVTSTSELTVGLMISLLRHIPSAHADVTRHGRWHRDSYRSRQLSRLTLGLVGLGRIGGHVAGYARAFNMKVLAYDPWKPDATFAELGVSRSSLAELMAECDIVSIHANLRQDNIHLVGRAELALMQPSALLINTARGALVDEFALAEALRTGKLSGAAVDVLETEHGDSDWQNSPLIAAARDGLNVIVTPHIGGCTSDAMHITEERLAEVVVNEILQNS